MKLRDIVEQYAWKSRCRPNEELNWFRRQPALRSAIEFAALAKNSEGKRFQHQRRLREGSLHAARNSLVKNESKIRRCKDFDELHNLLFKLLHLKRGIGELYIYDTAFRIGARLGILPAKVYLHCGTRDGARALGFKGGSSWIEVSDLPKELRRHKPYEIEDFLCIEKDRIGHDC